MGNTAPNFLAEKSHLTYVISHTDMQTCLIQYVSRNLMFLLAPILDNEYTLGTFVNLNDLLVMISNHCF